MSELPRSYDTWRTDPEPAYSVAYEEREARFDAVEFAQEALDGVTRSFEDALARHAMRYANEPDQPSARAARREHMARALWLELIALWCESADKLHLAELWVSDADVLKFINRLRDCIFPDEPEDTEGNVLLVLEESLADAEKQLRRMREDWEGRL